jgi:hypothetical protein
VVWAALTRLQQVRLLAEPMQVPVTVDRRSRRDMLKKLGVAFVTLPAILSITAESAAGASMVGRPCMKDSDCTGVVGAAIPLCCANKCIDASSSPANCGRCGNKCLGSRTCAGGNCVGGQAGDPCDANNPCIATFGCCGGKCIDILSDANNCGSCGNVCPSGQACVGGKCSTSCPTGMTLCGANCVNLQTDAMNCGSCGNACSSGQTCQGGRCVTQCPAGQTLCGNTCVNLKSDKNNCGSCGNACLSAQSCTNGACLCANGAPACQKDSDCPAGEVCGNGCCV